MRADPVASHARTATPHLDRLEATFRSASPVFRDAVGRQFARFGATWAQPFDELIGRMFPGDEALAIAVDAYARFALDGLRLQSRFEETGAYARAAYAEVVRDVYLDDRYMRTTYLPGLLLSHYLWPHHYRQAQFFQDAFLGAPDSVGPSHFYDVGVGTGFYSRLALTDLPHVHGVGIDISPSSLAYAASHVAAYGATDRYRVDLRNVVDAPLPHVDRLICVEVLEHLEDPAAFLAALRGMLRAGGSAFIATAINAPNADHIHLYRSAAEVALHLEAAGFRVGRSFVADAGTPLRPGAPVAQTAAFIVT